VADRGHGLGHHVASPKVWQRPGRAPGTNAIKPSILEPEQARKVPPHFGHKMWSLLAQDDPVQSPGQEAARLISISPHSRPEVLEVSLNGASERSHGLRAPPSLLDFGFETRNALFGRFEHRPRGGREDPPANSIGDVRKFRTRCDQCCLPLPESRLWVLQCSRNSLIHGTTEVGEPMRGEEVAEDVTQHLRLDHLTSHESVIRADRHPALPA
jgi:hypothetical protein